jgi:hypothetical protein
VRVQRRTAFGWAAAFYVMVVAALTLTALHAPFLYYIRFVILIPSSVPLLLVDWWGGVLLFGPDPEGVNATAFFLSVAVAAAIVQVLLAALVARARSADLS